jgi:PAS domain S-box-containing protein
MPFYFTKNRKKQRGEMATTPESSLSYETILDHIQAGVVVFDTDGLIITINDIAARLIGMDPTTMIGGSFYDAHWKFVKADGTGLAPEEFPVNKVMQEKTPVRDMVLGFSKGKSHRVVWLLASATPICNGGGVIDRVVLSFVEISERVNEQRLFLKAFDLSAALMAISTIEDGRYINVNESFCEKTGYSREEVLGKTSKELSIFVDYKQRQAVLERLQSEGRVRNVETSIRTKSGRELRGLFHADIIVLEEKKHLLTVFNDITETFEALESRRRAEREWQQTFDGSRDGICLLDPDQKIIRCNRAMTDLIGKTRDKINGKHCYEVVHGTSAPIKGCPVERMKQSLRRETMELQINARCFEVSADPILDENGGLCGIVHSIRDITERILSREELARSEEKYRALAESSPEMIYLVDKDGIVQYINTASAKMFHAPAERIMGKPLTAFFPGPVAAKHLAAIKGVIKTGKPLAAEMIEPFPGGMCWIDVRLTPVRDGSGAIIGVLGLSQDISERKRIEQELKKSIELYHDLVETAQDLIWQCDAEGRYTYLNPAWETVFGYKVEEMLGKKFTDFMSAEQGQKDMREYSRLLNAGMTMGYETVHRAKDGREINLVFNAKYIRDENRTVVGTRGTAYDITERKRVMQALSESEQKYRALIEQNTQGVALIDEQGIIIEWNKSLRRITGIGSEAAVGKPIWEIQLRLTSLSGHKKADQEAFLKTMTLEATRTGIARIFDEPQEMSIVVAGTVRHVQQTIFPIKTNKGFRLGCIIQDITQKKAAEEALAESEKRLHSLFSNMAEGVALHEIVFDPEGKPVNYRIVDGNLQYEKILGIKREDACGKLATEVYGTAAPPYLVEFTTPGLTGIASSFETYFAPMDKHFDISIAPWGKNGFATIFTDISHRKQSEAALIAEKERAQQYLDIAGVMFVALDTQGIVTLINQKGCVILDSKEDEIVGKNWFDTFVPAAVKNEVKAVFAKMMAGNILPVEYFENEVVTGKGELRTIAWHNAILKDHLGAIMGSLSSGEDITHRKKMEDELVRKQKFDALSVLAGGIAHDFNNLLAGVFGFMDLARESMKPGDPAVGYLGKAFIAFERAKALSRQLLTFSKGGVPIKKPLRIADLLRECSSLSLSGSNIKCVLSLPEDRIFVDADEHQLSQVFSNIMINARQAMPDGGTLSIAVETKTVGENEAAPVPPGRFAMTRIKDDGIGIPDTIINKIFDPFFSTKQQGSGLGLAICYSIIKRHGGHIGVTSKPGEGATFDVWLPVSEQTPLLESAGTERSSLKGSGRILVMDDEPSIRDLAIHMLKTSGYSVVTVSDGSEAIEKYRTAFTSGKPFDLVILDLTVPGGMGGDKAIKELLKIDPNVVACVSSGYADNAILSDPAAYGFSAMIAKPYSMTELLKTVKQALGKKHGSRKR